jgi:hypothetical protein
MASFSPQAVFLALGANNKQRQGAHRAMCHATLDQAAIDNIRVALNQNQPLGDSRFMTKIAKVTGKRREERPRGLPRKGTAAVGSARLAVFACYVQSDRGPFKPSIVRKYVSLKWVEEPTNDGSLLESAQLLNCFRWRPKSRLGE